MEITDLSGKIFDLDHNHAVFTRLDFGQDSFLEHETFQSTATTEFRKKMEEPEHSFLLALGFLDIISIFQSYLKLNDFREISLLNESLKVVASSVNALLARPRQEGIEYEVDFEININHFCKEANDFSPYFFHPDTPMLLEFMNKLLIYSYTKIHRDTNMPNTYIGRSGISLSIKHKFVEDDDNLKLNYKIIPDEDCFALKPDIFISRHESPERRLFLYRLDLRTDGIVALKHACMYMKIVK